MISALSSEAVMGMALLGNGSHPLAIERSDGHTSIADLGWWLGDPRAHAPAELAALELVEAGPVLDVGSATGRHLQLLRARGLKGYGIDTCAAAIALARRRGMRCQVADVWRFKPNHRFRAVVALGGNLGIAGRHDRLLGFLTVLERFVEPGGRLLVSSVDWRASAGHHAGFIASQRANGRYPGDVRMRLRYGEAVSRWFEWLWADLDLLRQRAEAAGLQTARVLRWQHRYVAELIKERS